MPLIPRLLCSCFVVLWLLVGMCAADRTDLLGGIRIKVLSTEGEELNSPDEEYRKVDESVKSVRTSAKTVKDALEKIKVADEAAQSSKKLSETLSTKLTGLKEHDASVTKKDEAVNEATTTSGILTTIVAKEQNVTKAASAAEALLEDAGAVKKKGLSDGEKLKELQNISTRAEEQKNTTATAAADCATKVANAEAAAKKAKDALDSIEKSAAAYIQQEKKIINKTKETADVAMKVDALYNRTADMVKEAEDIQKRVQKAKSAVISAGPDGLDGEVTKAKEALKKAEEARDKVREANAEAQEALKQAEKYTQLDGAFAKVNNAYKKAESARKAAAGEEETADNAMKKLKEYSLSMLSTQTENAGRHWREWASAVAMIATLTGIVFG